VKSTERISIERYLQRATWGLWGKKRKDGQAELRGIIEDKLWRLKLLGLNESEAEKRALDEMGKASELAAGFSRVHSLPLVLQGVLLVSLLSALGVQMVGAAAGIRAVPFQNKIPTCEASDSLESCGDVNKKLNYYLPVDELFKDLKSSGLDLKKLNLTILGTDVFGGKSYYSMFNFINSLLDSKDTTLHLKGEQNPNLKINSVTIVLGTPQAPVMADSLVLPAVWTQLKNQFQSEAASPGMKALPPLVAFVEIFQHRAQPLQQLSGLPDGRYALITSIYDSEGCNCGLQLRIKTIDDGLLPLINSKTALRLVDTPEALANAKAIGIPAVLVYRVGEIDDLHTIPLTPVQISNFKVVTK